MEITINDAREELLPQIQRIEQQSFSVPWTEQMLRMQLAPDSHVFLTAQTADGVAGYVGIMDLTKAGDLIRGRTFSAFLPLIAVACIYLFFVMLLTWLVGKLERRLRSSER